MHTTPIHTQSSPAALARTERAHPDAATQSAMVRTDEIRISSSARALAAQYRGEGYTGERVALIRTRIENGSYHRPAFVEALAWRLIEAGLV